MAKVLPAFQRNMMPQRSTVRNAHLFQVDRGGREAEREGELG